MVINAKQADRYRLNIQNYEITNQDDLENLYLQLRYDNPISIPSSDSLYTIDQLRLIQDIENNTILNKIKRTYGEYLSRILSLIETWMLGLQRGDGDRLNRFLNSAIPGLDYITVINRYSNINHLSSESLNILKTGEPLTYKIDKYYISLLDILQSIMSIKFYKKDFTNESLDRIDFN